SLVPTQHPKLLRIRRRRFRSLEEEGLPGVSVFRTDQEVFGTRRTVLVVYNEALFVAQSRTLLREIAKRQQKLNDLSRQLERWQRGEVRGGNPPRLDSTRKKLAGWLQLRHMKELFEVHLIEKNRLPVLRYRFLQPAWKQLQSTLLGKNLLFTDQDDWTDAQIVAGYRSQSQIEDAFRTMKDPHHIALRPQFHWTDQKIRVHVFICVIALMLVSLLRRELHAKGFALSIPAALELLADIREMVMVFPPQEKGADPSLRTSLTRMTSQQRQVFAALQLQRYSSA
ncbi:MAG: IS1634 family transposase, partial [Nitrospirales bacterium]